jgi:hypothetical protein
MVVVVRPTLPGLALSDVSQIEWFLNWLAVFPKSSKLRPSSAANARQLSERRESLVTGFKILQEHRVRKHLST